jgi:hypothetical protein
MQVLQLGVQFLRVTWVRNDNAQVTVCNHKMTDFLKKSAVKMIFLLECNPDTPNPSRPNRPFRHEIGVFHEKNRIKGLLTAVTTQNQTARNRLYDTIWLSEDPRCKNGRISPTSEKRIAALVADINPYCEEMFCLLWRIHNVLA